MMRRFPSRFFALGSIMLAATSAFGGPAPAGSVVGARQFCSDVDMPTGVVSVNDPIAAEVGAGVLAAGGNAVDAAVAVAYALNVLEPLTSGIGGGGFMMVHMALTNETKLVDFREKAPAAARPDMFGNLSFLNASTCGRAVGVPGEVAGLAKALDEWGTMPWADLIAPAIFLAQHGVPVSKYVAENTGDVRTSLDPETAAIFRPNGVPLQEGDWLVQRDLAHTLLLIANGGRDAFYQGEIAEDIVEAQKFAGSGKAGLMTLSDLANYEAEIRTPVFDEYRGYTIASTGSPSSGGLTTLQVLSMVERFPLGDSSLEFGSGSVNSLHVLVEALRLGFADRAFYMGDKDFVPVPEAELLSPLYTDCRSSFININSRMATPSPGGLQNCQFPQQQALTDENPVGETTHFSIVDAEGNMVSCTVSIEQLWGTGIMVRRPEYNPRNHLTRGFLLNNQLTDFNRTPLASATNPGANDVAGGKRPRSSMEPTLLFRDGVPVAALGSPGGATIISSVAQTIINLLDHEMTPQEAIDYPRISVTSAAGTVTAEDACQLSGDCRIENALTGLGALNHPISNTRSEIGAVNAVFMDSYPPRQCGVGDPRRGGAVARPWF